MAEPQRRLMTPEEFFAWQLDRKIKTGICRGC